MRKKIELHLAAEREMLHKCFAFNHINYLRYWIFQHINFSEIKHCNQNVWNNLLRQGFGESLSGQPFSTMHRDLITKVIIDWKVKVRGAPMMGGYCTSDKTNDAFIKTKPCHGKGQFKVEGAD